MVKDEMQKCGHSQKGKPACRFVMEYTDDYLPHTIKIRKSEAKILWKIHNANGRAAEFIC